MRSQLIHGAEETCHDAQAPATNLMRSVARQAGPRLLEATLGPTVCFIAGRALWGVDGALALALAWTGACMARRALRGGRMSGLLLIGMTTLVLRASVALALHSEQAYLIAPALVTIVMGVVFVASAVAGKPLLSWVINDLVPAQWVDTSDWRIARLCRLASAVWGAEQMISAMISLALIRRVSPTTYVVFHEPVSLAIFVVVIGATAPLFWADIRAIWPGATPAQTVRRAFRGVCPTVSLRSPCADVADLGSVRRPGLGASLLSVPLD